MVKPYRQIVVILVILLVIGTTLSAQARLVNPTSAEVAAHWQYQPTPESAKAEDTTPPAVRQARERYFDSFYGSDTPLGQPSNRMDFITQYEIPETPVYPKEWVVTGTFRQFRSYLTDSERSIYTDVTIAVDGIITTPAQGEQTPVAVGDTLTVLIEGGSVKRNDGKVLTWVPGPRLRDDIQPGRRYLLFLRYKEDGQFYELVKSWDLTSGISVATDPWDISRAKAGTSRYSGLPANEMVDKLREDLNTAQGGHQP